MSRTYLFLRWFFLITLIGGFALANQASAADCPRKHSYAVYLSPGYEPGVRWGGYHVTITKFSKSHVCKRKGGMKTALHDVWKKPYSFKSKKEGEDYWGEASGGIYGVVFKSDLLTSQAQTRATKARLQGGEIALAYQPLQRQRGARGGKIRDDEVQGGAVEGGAMAALYSPQARQSVPESRNELSAGLLGGDRLKERQHCCLAA